MNAKNMMSLIHSARDSAATFDARVERVCGTRCPTSTDSRSRALSHHSSLMVSMVRIRL